MKPYVNHDYISLKGLIIFLLCTVPIGISVGIIAYFISTVVYLHFVFPLVIGFLALFAFTLPLSWSKIRHPIIISFFGFLTGIYIALSFYATPFEIEKTNFIRDLQKDYHVDKEVATQEFEKILLEETSSSGLLGYMKLRAREGESYTSYLVINSISINEFNYTIKSTWAWIYWIIETLLFSLPLVFLTRSKGYFNSSTNELYGLQNQFGSIAIEDKANFFEFLNSTDAQKISELIIPEDNTKHPALELYSAHTGKKIGDVLLIIKETSQVNPIKVARKQISEWEISQNDFLLFKNAVSQKMSE